MGDTVENKLVIALLRQVRGEGQVSFAASKSSRVINGCYSRNNLLLLPFSHHPETFFVAAAIYAAVYRRT